MQYLNLSEKELSPEFAKAQQRIQKAGSFKSRLAVDLFLIEDIILYFLIIKLFDKLFTVNSGKWLPFLQDWTAGN